MLALLDLQRTFAQALMGEGNVELPFLIKARGMNPASRLAIYRVNVKTRLSAAIATAYPVVCELVGQGFFDYSINSFIRTTPPATSCLAEYAAGFATFLEGFSAADTVPYLADVARLEWAICQAARSAPRQPVPRDAHVEVLKAYLERGVDAAGIALKTSPCVKFMSSRYPIDEIWRSHQEPGSVRHVNLSEGSVYLQVCGGERIHLRRLNRARWTFRAALAQGQTLGEACEAAASVDDKTDWADEISRVLEDDCIVEVAHD
jgi:hypothetical protein